ncbi:MAG: hypothetical protein M1819_002193 [Sarea resinae]|nr:MAG: hypothetical protein M1819_002193 [Sarea resinae]
MASIPDAAFIVAISGCSSSGKTTLARILRDIFPCTCIVHEDDFYKPDDQIPIKNGVQDWDCAGAIDIPQLTSTFAHIHADGELPATHHSKEDQNATGPSPIAARVLEAHQRAVREWSTFGVGAGTLGAKKSLVLLDGFLLYSAPFEEVQDYFDLKLFLRTTRATLKARREGRAGYVTLAGFWQDPPGYVDDVVWPNYEADHAFLFEDGDVEGRVDRGVAHKQEIEVAPGVGNESMEELVSWAVELIKHALVEKDKRKIGLHTDGMMVDGTS